MAETHTESMKRLMEEFTRLPGIGRRSAERLSYFILKQPAEKAMRLAQAIKDVKTKIHQCRRCYNLSEQELCDICRDTKRDHTIVCVVEQPKDLLSLEETGMCDWVYHVLGGHLAPLEGITPDNLTIESLVKRVADEGVKEIVMATNPNMDGDGTSLYISSLLDNSDVKITRLARGLPSGGSIEYANKSVLSEAIIGRANMK